MTGSSQRLAIVAVVLSFAACGALQGRDRNRQGNRLYGEGKFVDAAGEYERALADVDDPTIHYNAGLAYWKIFRAGYDKPVLLAKASEAPCAQIPATKSLDARVCVREGDRHYVDCDDKNPCAPLYTCEKATFCALDGKAIADAAAKHLQIWIDVQPSDEDLKERANKVEDDIGELNTKRDALSGQPDADQREIQAVDDEIKDLQKKLDTLHTKEQTRGIMTQMWIDSDQFDKALAYWTKLLDEKPKHPEDIMNVLAGINLKANDWKTSIEWYKKAAAVSTETAAKIAAYKFIGNVAWAKLNSKALPAAQAIELSDLGIGALQKASELQPENPSLIGLQGSLYSFRSMLQGASWAAAIDRASTQDLQRAARVLRDKAKKAQEAPKGAAQNPPVVGGGGRKTGG